MGQPEQSFEPRSGRKNIGGSVALADGSTFDFGKALSDGGGTIVTKDPQVADRLREVGALKEVSSSEAKSSSTKKGD